MEQLTLLKPDFRHEPEEEPLVRRSPVGHYVLSAVAWLLLAVICWAFLAG